VPIQLMGVPIVAGTLAQSIIFSQVLEVVKDL
jgi:hypothetical protein